MKPTIGLLVHFYDVMMAGIGPNGEGPYAAVVTTIHHDVPELVDLQPMPTSVFGGRHYVAVPYDEVGTRTMYWNYAPTDVEERWANAAVPDATIATDVPSNENVL